MTGIVGWAVGNPFLQGTYAEGVVPMQPATGVACIGWAWRWLLRCSGKAHGFVDGIVPTVLVFALLGYIEPSSAPETVGHNVPSLGTVLGFLVALLPASRAIIITLGSLSSLAIVGHVTGDPRLYFYFPSYCTGMAITTAVALLTIAAAKIYRLHDRPGAKS